jgi:hypothetical protein
VRTNRKKNIKKPMQITSPSSLRNGWAVYSGATPIAYIFNCFFVLFMFSLSYVEWTHRSLVLKGNRPTHTRIRVRVSSRSDRQKS